PDAVRGALQSHSLEPELIEIELTERSLTADAGGALERLYDLKDIGVRLAVDDFGAGQLGLGDLQKLPVDVLKIGRSLVSELDTSREDQIVCSAILSISHTFPLHAVADGLNSEQQESFLTRHDCLYGQGNYYRPPVEPARIGMMMA